MLNMKEMISGPINNANHVTRYGLSPVHRKQSLAEHIHYVSRYSLLIGLDLQNRRYEVNLPLTVFRAMFHDDEELELHDIIKPVKIKFPEIKEAMEKVAPRAVEDVYRKIGVPDPQYMVNLWKTAKDNSLEGRIVEFADILDVLAYTFEELSNGSREMNYIFKATLNGMDRFRDEIFGMYVKSLENIVSEIRL